jgi:hypothetical protein
METLEDLGRFTRQDVRHVFMLGKSEMESARPPVPAELLLQRHATAEL